MQTTLFVSSSCGVPLLLDPDNGIAAGQTAIKDKIKHFVGRTFRNVVGYIFCRSSTGLAYSDDLPHNNELAFVLRYNKFWFFV